MKDDYLWDKSGAPDPEIVQLEQLLGDLRYRRPGVSLPLPKRAPARPGRTFFAIAAAALFMMMAAGVWFAVGQRNQGGAAGLAAINAQPGSARDWLNPESFAAMTPQAIDAVTHEPERGIHAPGALPDRKQRRSSESKRGASTDAQLARSASPNRRERINMDEGVAAREQLIKALHLASSKLNQVQKKIQDNKAPGPVS
jgi:hypothetical protein